MVVADEASWQTSSAALGGGAFLIGASLVLPNVKRMTLLECEARLLVFDSSLRKLTPTFPPDGVEGGPINWSPGQGVVGVAYANQDYELASGEVTHDDTYRLTPRCDSASRASPR